MIPEDLTVYLKDHGMPCQAGAVPFTGILDQPDEVLDFQHTGAKSRQYQLMYISAAVTLLRGQAITCNGAAYKVREAPEQVDDGAFSTVLLTKV